MKAKYIVIKTEDENLVCKIETVNSIHRDIFFNAERKHGKIELVSAGFYNSEKNKVYGEADSLEADGFQNFKSKPEDLELVKEQIDKLNETMIEHFEYFS